LITDGNGDLVCADWIFRDLSVGKVRYLAGARAVFGQRVFISAKRLSVGDAEKDGLLMLAFQYRERPGFREQKVCGKRRSVRGGTRLHVDMRSTP
jgi:hypothetical protein